VEEAMAADQPPFELSKTLPEIPPTFFQLSFAGLRTDNQGGDRPGDPSAQGQQRNDQYRPAAFVQYRQWRQKNAE
jgi:hypothetical protein